MILKSKLYLLYNTYAKNNQPRNKSDSVKEVVLVSNRKWVDSNCQPRPNTVANATRLTEAQGCADYYYHHTCIIRSKLFSCFYTSLEPFLTTQFSLCKLIVITKGKLGFVLSRPFGS